MKNNYLKRIDEILNEMQQEYKSKHEKTTKIINYEYYCGKLQALYELIEDTEELQDFIICYEYRKEDRDNMAQLFNDKLITPLYNIAKANRF